MSKAKLVWEMLESPEMALKDKSGVGIIVDYSRDYTLVNGV